MRYCDICGHSVAFGVGVVWKTLDMLVHAGSCNQVLESFTVDYSKSKRGRRRSAKEIVKLVDEYRNNL